MTTPRFFLGAFTAAAKCSSKAKELKSDMKTYIITAPAYEARLTPLGKDKAHILAFQGDPTNSAHVWKQTRDEVISDLEAAQIVRRVRAARTTPRHDQP